MTRPWAVFHLKRLLRGPNVLFWLLVLLLALVKVREQQSVLTHDDLRACVFENKDFCQD